MKKFLISLLFLMFFPPSVIFGQGYLSFKYEREQIINNTKFQIGPFRIHPLFHIRDVGYDDNVYYQHEDERPYSDYTGTISPGVNIYLLFHNYLIISLNGSLEYVYYVKQKKERGWNNTFSPQFKLLFLNCIVIGGNYTRSNRRWRVTSEFNVKVNEQREGFRGSIFYETSRRTSLGISGSSEKFTYEDITLEGSDFFFSRWFDRKEQEGNIEFYYKIFSESFLILKGGYKEYNFEHPSYHWRDAYSYQMYAGIRFPLTAKIRGIFFLGYKKFIPKIRSKKSFAGLVGDSSLDFKMGRFSLRLRYNRDCYFSYWTENIFFLENSYAIGASFYLTKFLRLDYDFTYGEADYPEPRLQRVGEYDYEELRRKDIYHIHKAGFVFRIIRNIGIGLMMEFWIRDSNDYWENRDRMFLGGYVTYDF